MGSVLKNRIILFLVVSGTLIGVSFVFADQIRNFSYNQTFGAQRAIWQLASAVSFTNQDQIATNKELAEENQKLLSALADLKTIREENIFLKNALDIGIKNDRKLIEAEAFGGGRFNGKDFSYEDSIMVNKGKKDGVQKGFPVIISDKVLIGRVSEVYDDFSRVLLITDKASLIDVQIINNTSIEEVIKESANDSKEGDTDSENNSGESVKKEEKIISEKIIAIAKGEGGFKTSLDMFPKDKDLENGAIVMTSPLSGNFPSGFVVGTIKDPKKIDTETFKQAEIVPAFNPKLIDKVFILKNIDIVKND